MSRQVARVLIVAVALAHAAIFIAYQRPDWTTQWTDQNGYLMLGRALAQTGRFTRFPASADYVPEAIRTPVYPAFVAVIDRIFGESHAAIAWAQAALFAIICLLVYQIALGALGDRVAVAAGLVTALYPPLPYYGALVLTETLATFLVTAGLALWIHALRRNAATTFVASGLTFAVAALTRPSFQLLPLFLVVPPLFVSADRRRWWRGCAAMVVAYGIAVLPWIAYNMVEFKALTFSPAGGPGRQVFEGSWQVLLPGRLEAELTAAADAAPDTAALDAAVRGIAAREHRPAEPLLRYVHQHLKIQRIWFEPTDPRQRMSARIAADHEYLRAGIENIRRDPIAWAWGRLTRGAILFWAAEIPIRYSDINRLSTGLIRALWIAQIGLLLLAAVGAIALARAGAWIELGAFAALVVSVSVVHIPMYSEARYSLPAKPIVLLMATAGVIWMASGGRAERKLPPSQSQK